MPFRFGTRRSLGLPIGGGGAILKPQDVFATSLYTGAGAAQTVTSGVDLLGKGGLFWLKERTGASNGHVLMDTARVSGANDPFLQTNTTGAEVGAQDYINYLSTGVRFNSSIPGFNDSGMTYASWSFARAAKFFDTNIFTHTNGTPTNIDLSSLGVVGDAVVKRRDAAGDWYAWHRSLTAGNNLRLNTTDAQSTTNAFISVSGTTLTFSASAPSGSYTYEARAHDPSADGIVQCGGVNTGSDGSVTITLPWQAQWLMIKSTSAVSQWFIVDATRGFSPGYKLLYANLSNAEYSGTKAITATSSSVSIPGGELFSDLNSIVFAAIRAPY